jgi:hypothetical protein
MKNFNQRIVLLVARTIPETTTGLQCRPCDGTLPAMRRRFLCLALVFIAVSASAAEKQLFFWRVKSGKATAYLLGSLHVAKPDMYPLDPQIEKAFHESDALVVEADASPEKALPLAMKMMTKAMYPPDDSLDRHISKATYDAVMARVPEAQTKMFKPWFVAMNMTLVELQKLGIDPQYGVDVHFLAEAKGKRIIELEGAEAQIELLDGFTDKEQEEFLKYTLNENESIGKSINDMIAAWNAGDAGKIEEYLTDSTKDSPEMQTLYRKLFDDRNGKMADRIEAMLKTGKTYFVVVGAGHLVGKTGLIQLLGKTHPVEQMPRLPR